MTTQAVGTKHAVLSGEAGGGEVIQLVKGLRRGDVVYAWTCGFAGCQFRREFATVRGAQERITHHRLQVHHVQTLWRIA